MRDNNSEQEAPVIQWRINEWFPDLSPEIKTCLKSYHDELIKSNKTLGLVSPKAIFVADAIHFADSILASRIVGSSIDKAQSIYDFGSGNGFPGVVFGILNPQVNVVLVESDSRKCEFLTGLVASLKLKNISVQNKTVESLGDGTIQFAMARGFSNISRALMAARKSIVKGGALFHLKSEEWGIEVGEIPTQLCSIWSPSLAGEYKLPVGAVKFAVVKTVKIS